LIKLVVANQKGGVAKTVTTLAVARECAERGMKVLLIDIDAQGSIGAALGLKPSHYLYSFIISNFRFKDCMVKAHANIDVICSNRETNDLEGILMPRTGRELVLSAALTPIEHDYDVILIDCPPSISLLQSCALMYTQQILIPLTMDPLSLQGAFAAIQTAATLNQLFKTDIKPVALLPAQVDRRMQMTELIMDSLETLATQQKMLLLPSVRTDSTVTKATRSKRFLLDFDPKCKAVEDYRLVTSRLVEHLKEQLTHEWTSQAQA
jgi:chromosome partitioning protein